MSTPLHDSQQILDRNSNSLFSPVSSCNTEMTYNISKHLDISTTNLSRPGTKMLQVEQYGKPPIVLTSHDHDCASPESAKSRPLLHLSKPVGEDKTRNSANCNIFDLTLAAEEENVSLIQLRADLNAHFQCLKREFEVKRGNSWTPLRPWANEWEWEWDDEDSAGVFD